MIRLDRRVASSYADGTVAVHDLTSSVAPRRARDPGRAVRLRQDDDDANGQPARRAHRRVASSSTASDVIDVDPVDMRRGMGYVIQHVGLFPHRTVRDNVADRPRAARLGSRRDGRERAGELLELVGLRPGVHGPRYPHELSGGQRQRVGVARALAADPPVLLMDEPFSAVDPIVRDQLQEEFLRLQDEVRKTILFVTHDIEEAVRLGDRIAVFAPGRRTSSSTTPPRRSSAPPRRRSSPTSSAPTAASSGCR